MDSQSDLWSCEARGVARRSHVLWSSRHSRAKHLGVLGALRAGMAPESAIIVSRFRGVVTLGAKLQPCQETSVANVADAVEQYLEWKAFACWFEPLSGARTELPKRVAT